MWMRLLATKTMTADSTMGSQRWASETVETMGAPGLGLGASVGWTGPASPSSAAGLLRTRRRVGARGRIHGVDPPGTGLGKGIGVGHVGLQIQHRRAVQQVHTPQAEG